MSNSSLVSYTRLSPNHSGKRTQAVSRITPHCVVGNCSVESLGEVFAKPSRQASSNYGIGVDGRVALYVDEGNRSWCSSSGANDQKAVTIECASDTKEPYAFKDAVYASLIELCADICRRNGKTKLLWIPEKDKALVYEPKADEMLLTVHRWFAATACPGTWMMGHMADLTEKVTAKLGGSVTSGVEVGVSGGTLGSETGGNILSDLTDAEMEKAAWDFLMHNIGNAYGVAGLLGNIRAESGMRSTNLQNSFEKRFGMTDAVYTAAVDSGAYGNFVRDGAGYGLAQWTFWSRKQALLDYARSKGVSIGDAAMQWDFLMKELKESYPGVLKALKGAKSVREASDAVLTKYERPADQSEGMKQKRAGYGMEFYEKYAGKGDMAAPGNGSEAEEEVKVPFLVKAKNLPIRTGPGEGYPMSGRTTGNGVFTIVEVKDGYGRLKSGVGWIELKNAVRK